MPFAAANPYTGQPLAQYPDLSGSELKGLLDGLATAQKDWANVPVSERVKGLAQVAGLLRQDLESHSRLITAEMGKHIREARAEVEKCAALCDYMAQNAALNLANEAVPTEATKSYVLFQPLGGVLAVMPWNFPFWQAFRAIVPALAAGNFVILKHASNVPGSSLAIESIFSQAGYGELVRQAFVPTDRLEEIVSHAGIQGVTLTGSEKAGISIATLAARYLKKQVLELGGSDPFIVLEGADLEYAASMAVKSRMINTGQSCIAAKRFVVADRIHDDFLRLFSKKMEALTFGDPMDEAMSYGPMARQDLAEELETQVARSLAMGARLETGTGRKSGGAIFQATILSNVAPGMPAFDEELFGPVASVVKARNEAEAVQLANESPFGLGASVWTADIEAGERVAAKLQSGSVFVNEMMKSDQRLPFGGVKRSGYGRELSAFGLREFVNVKTVWVK